MEEILKKRLQNILLSYLKGVRDEVEIKDKLTRPVKVGGMDFNETQAKQTINILKEKKTQVKITGEIIKVPQEMDFVPSAPKPEEYAQLLWRSKNKFAGSQNKTSKEKQLILQEEKKNNLSDEKLATKKETKEEKKGNLPVKKDESNLPIIKPTEEISIKKMPAPKEEKKEYLPVEKVITEKETKKEDLPVEKILVEDLNDKATVNQIKRPPVNSNNRINDIEQPFRVSDPINELAELTLTDFRRWTSQLDNQLSKSAERIKQKIDLLGEESLIKKIAGIQAWQRSAIYQLYLTLGRVSLEQNKPLTEIIKQRSLQNKPTLNLDEFNALVELNRQMTY